MKNQKIIALLYYNQWRRQTFFSREAILFFNGHWGSGEVVVHDISILSLSFLLI